MENRTITTTHPAELDPIEEVRRIVKLKENQNQLRARLRRMLGKYGSLRGGGGIEEQAEDLFQETVVRALKHARRYKPSEKPGSDLGWLLKIAERLLIDAVRRGKRSKVRHSLDEMPENRDIDPRTLPVRDDVPPVWEWLPHLKPSDRHILEVYAFEGLSGRQLAERLDLASAKSAVDRVSRIKSKVREIVQSAHRMNRRGVG